MITTELPVNLMLPPPINPRSSGLHVSNIIRCIATESGILRPEWAEELSLTDVREIRDPVAILRMSIGLAWEEWYIQRLEGVADHSEEICYEGIYMSPDGESLDVIITPNGRGKHVLMLHELKTTWKSLNTVGDLTGQFMWLSQMKSYCKALGTCLATLHVLFLCGDYKFPIKPTLKVWRIEFTQDELDKNWSLLTDYASHRLKLEGEKRKAEESTFNWEDVRSAR